MTVNVCVPEGLWEEGQEGVVGTWYYQSGEKVSEGQVVAEILTEKVTHDIDAPANGTLSILVAEEQPVVMGEPIAYID
ncbi:MAG: biotin/lipoyl-containing protein [Pseudomonadota bacterium]